VGFLSPCHLVILLGLGLRLYHYLRDPSMWHDEAALVLNVLGKSFAELLGPLFFSEAAPPLFLWLEKGVAGVLGDGTYALRLLPFLASCAALLGLTAVGRRCLSPAGILWLVVLFGCSDRLLWHGCEAKPYAVDVLVATGLLFALTGTASWPLNRQLLLLAFLTPLLIFLSYPACFLLGGLALSLLPAVLRARRTGTWLLFGAFLTAAGVSFLLLLAGPIHAQRDESLLRCWEDMFPSWNRPWTVPGWLLQRLEEVARYACEPVGGVLAAVAGVGAVGWWRSGQRRLVIFVLAPVALAGLAGLLGQYPFGPTRVMVFAAPGLILLMAAGLPPTLGWLRHLPGGSRGPGLAAFCLLAGVGLFPLAQAIYRVGWPWPRADSVDAATFVRAHCRAGEQVVGTAWEHDYYFRDRGNAYQFLPQAAGERTLLRGAGSRVWLLAAGKTGAERRESLRQLQAVGTRPVLARLAFRHVTVFYLDVPAVPLFFPNPAQGGGRLSR
jgi:hypothetical protein